LTQKVTYLLLLEIIRARVLKMFDCLTV